MIRFYRYARYEQNLVFPKGKYLMDLNDAPREKVKEYLPWFKDAAQMGIRIGFNKTVRAQHGGFAEEVHDFQNVRQAGMQLLQIKMNDGRVIEMTIH